MTVEIREAAVEDAPVAGRMLDTFQREFGEPSPGPEFFGQRIAELIAVRDTVVLLAGEGPEGFALLRFRPGLYSAGPECYLAELYVVPDRRGQGIGRALMERAFEVARSRGADHMDLGTSTDDIAAIALYERLGFTNREGGPDGPSMLYYEREL